MKKRVGLGRADAAGDADSGPSGAGGAPIAPRAAAAVVSVPKRRHKRSKGNIFAGIVAFLTLVGLVAAPFWLIKAGAGARSYQADTSFANAYHIGDLVHDGTVSFVIESMQCGQTEVGKHHSVQGQFCTLDLTVQNDGPLPIRFNAISQRAMGSHGGFYIPDPTADAIVNNASDTIPDVGDPQHAEEATLAPPVAPALEPGQSGRYSIVFDIPISVKLTKIELHATEYSHGAEVLFSR